MARKKTEQAVKSQDAGELKKTEETPKSPPRSHWLSADLPPCPTPADIDSLIEKLYISLQHEHEISLEVFNIEITHVVAGHLPEANPDRYRNILTVFAKPLQATTEQEKIEQPLPSSSLPIDKS